MYVILNTKRLHKLSDHLIVVHLELLLRVLHIHPVIMQVHVVMNQSVYPMRAMMPAGVDLVIQLPEVIGAMLHPGIARIGIRLLDELRQIGLALPEALSQLLGHPPELAIGLVAVGIEELEPILAGNASIPRQRHPVSRVLLRLVEQDTVVRALR